MMRFLLSHGVALAAMAAGVWSHAVVDTPSPRKTGPMQKQLCGAALTKALERDITSPIEDAMKKADGDYNCNAYLCRGYQYQDNMDNVKAVQAGDVLVFHVDLVAGHRPGYANVSVVDLGTNTIIGEPLRTWAAWPDSESGPPRNDIDFNITIPETLGSTCDVGGKCVLQWYWWAINNKQTYESCLDFYVES